MEDANQEVKTDETAPVEAPRSSDEHLKAIEETINKIRPYLIQDGGDCELVEVSPDGKKVFLRLKGACSGCPGAMMTLKMGVERMLKEKVPGVASVEAVPF